MATATLGGVIAAARRLNEPDADSDAELLRRFAGTGDEGAFALLVGRYGRLVLSACRRIVPDRHLADDAFQATFVVLATKAKTLDGQRPLGPWLYAVACQVSVRARAMIGRRRKRETLTGTVPDTPAVGTGLRAGDDSLAILDEEIAKLSSLCRDAVVLCELQGLSRRDAAKKLGIAEGTLSSRLAAARKALAERLRARGVVAPAAVAISAIFVPTDLAAAAVAVSTGRIELSTQLLTLVKGGLAMTLVTKLKLGAAALAVAVLLLGVGGWGGLPGDEAAAAPVPKAEADPGLIWLYDTKAGKLTAVAPDGKKQKELTVPDGDRFLGFLPDGGKIAFVGKNGKLAEKGAKDGLTVHLRTPSVDPTGTDTGLAHQPGDILHWSPDGGRVVRVRFVDPDKQGAMKHPHAVYDLATKQETKLELPANQYVIGWSADGKELLLHEYVRADLRDPNLPRYRVLTVPAVGGDAKPMCETVSLTQVTPTGDGGELFGMGHAHSNPEDATDATYRRWYRLDGKGKATLVKAFDDDQVDLRLAPDRKRVAFLAWTGDGQADTTVLVLDADGKAEQKVLTLSGDGKKTRLLGWFPVNPKPADPPKKNAPVPGAKPKPNYFPHEKGTTWVYENSLENPRGPKTLLMKEVTDVTADGKDTLVTVSQWSTTDPPLPGGPGPTEESVFRVTAAGDVLSVRFGKLVMDPPSLFVRAALKADDEWEFRRGEAAVKYAFKVEKAAELTVPAGTYTAVPLRMLVDGKPTGNVTYFADGVGMVKSAGYVLSEFKPGRTRAAPPRKNAPVPKAELPGGAIALLSGNADKAMEVVKTDGTSVKVTAVDGWDQPYFARLSPDGQRLLWSEKAPKNAGAEVGSTWRVRWLDLDAKQPKAATVTEDAYIRSVAWAHDGKSVFYSRIDQDKFTAPPKRGDRLFFETWRYDVTTDKKARVELPADQAVLEVSPDGQTLVTRSVAFETDVQRLFLVPLKTLTPVPIGEAVAVVYSPRFSPDGKRLLYSKIVDAPGARMKLTVCVRDLATGKETAVAVPEEVTAGGAYHLCWSPDGKRIALHWHAGGNGKADRAASRVTVCDADGGNAKLIVKRAPGEDIVGLDWR